VGVLHLRALAQKSICFVEEQDPVTSGGTRRTQMRFFSVSPIYLLMTNEKPFLEIWNRSLGRVDGWCGSMQVLESPQRFLAFHISPVNLIGFHKLTASVTTASRMYGLTTSSSHPIRPNP